MEKVKVYGKPRLIPISTGHCTGCTHGLVEKVLAEVIDEMGIEGNTIGIGGVGCGMGTFLIMDIDAIGAPHGPALALGTGLKHALYERPVIITAQGDGDCSAIGMGYLINAAVRAERLTCVMVNNGNYGTTGGQLAPTTLIGQVTTTSPKGRDAARFGYPVHVPELLAQIQGVAFAARTALNNPANYTRTKKYIKTAVQRQIDDVGFTFVEILGVCPPDWHLDPLESLDFLETKTMAEFPLGVFRDATSTG
ncbi:MAG: thiamine pyrophosphate-dependent enzyme [Chloroflexota bacterium]|nr:thiamine pyrophosphate-dependent enzyme [Chloroflexota bacterium]